MFFFRSVTWLYYLTMLNCDSKYVTCSSNVNTHIGLPENTQPSECCINAFMQPSPSVLSVLWFPCTCHLAVSTVIVKMLHVLLMSKPISVSLKIRRHQTLGYKTVLCLTQQGMNFILLINVEMPTIVGILTLIQHLWV